MTPNQLITTGMLALCQSNHTVPDFYEWIEEGMGRQDDEGPEFLFLVQPFAYQKTRIPSYIIK